MNNYVNYRYREFQNQSFQNEFRKSADKTADFTGARLKSCDFRGAGLAGADFSETAIGRDDKSFQSQITQMFLHIIAGLPIGLVTWLINQQSFIGCGGSRLDPYAWMIDPFAWIAAFAAAATISKKWLLALQI